ncbi:hypothetical protein K7H22_16430 [Seohaeicola saemankumensis]|uniref:hypothetical protein n=1 Tax=Seohaeicola saemankumensis TaxID=481181 RepID=UPI001E5CD488|nr:hypothetical protein [Seohaeicola saemankumensis]MCD1627592.1 hypothetical protein [Seohaeicola saemankumensis]
MQHAAAHLEAAVAARAREGVRRIGLLLVSAAFLATAAGFLTVAMWILLETTYSAQIAAVILGGLYLGAGGLALYAALSPSRSEREARLARAQAQAHAHPAGQKAPFPPLAEAFVFGLDTALRLRRSRDR